MIFNDVFFSLNCTSFKKISINSANLNLRLYEFSKICLSKHNNLKIFVNEDYKNAHIVKVTETSFLKPLCRFVCLILICLIFVKIIVKDFQIPLLKYSDILIQLFIKIYLV